jgi:hypothetical protein
MRLLTVGGPLRIQPFRYRTEAERDPRKTNKGLHGRHCRLVVLAAGVSGLITSHGTISVLASHPWVRAANMHEEMQ